MKEFEKSVVVVVLMFTGIEAARILAYFPTPSISHQVVLRPITQDLARRGHEVIVVTTDPVFAKGKAPANLTEIDVHEISYKSWEEFFKLKPGKKDDLWLQMETFYERITTIFELQMQIPEIKEIMKKDRKYFDLFLLEAWVRPVLGLIHKFDAPAIQISSFGAYPYHYQSMGSPILPILYPSPIRQRLYNLTLIEKEMEFYAYFKLELFQYNTLKYDNAVMRKIFGTDVPSFEELQSRVKMLFINEHPIWGDNHPVSSNIIYIGGILQNSPKEIPKDLKEYLDSSKNGVIYVSFGTNVLPSLLPPEKIKIMTQVLSQLPYDVLWKWDKDVLPGQLKNIRISKWFPQADLLKHPKIKLFITQGGLQSTDETINAGVPVIAMPIIADQWYNAEKYVHHKIGKQFEIAKLSETEFKEAVVSVIEDGSYKNNIVKLRSFMREQPVSPLNLSIWWAEHVIKYGGDYLKAPAANMSWFEYYEFELVLIALSIVLTVLASVGYYFIINLAFRILPRISKMTLKVKSH